MQRLENAVVEFQQSAGMAQQGFAHWRQCQTPTGFGQYRCANLLLKLLELCTHGRRRAAQAICRPGKTVELHAGHKRAQYIEVEGRPSHLIIHNFGTMGVI